MASFVPYYRKKQERLAKHEREFARLLARRASAEEVAEGIEMMRAAMIRVLKARREKLPASEKSASEVAELNAEITHWEMAPAAAVKKYFSPKSPANGG